MLWHSLASLRLYSMSLSLSLKDMSCTISCEIRCCFCNEGVHPGMGSSWFYEILWCFPLNSRKEASLKMSGSHPFLHLASMHWGCRRSWFLRSNGECLATHGSYASIHKGSVCVLAFTPSNTNESVHNESMKKRLTVFVLFSYQDWNKACRCQEDHCEVTIR